MAIPLNVSLQVIEDLKKYYKDNNITQPALARLIGVSPCAVKSWLNGEYKPQAKAITAMYDKGITKVRLPSEIQKRAVEKVLIGIDEGNRAKRPYRKRLMMPDIVANQIKLLIDDYIEALDTPSTYTEFKAQRTEFISKLYNVCKQGV